MSQSSDTKKKFFWYIFGILIMVITLISIIRPLFLPSLRFGPFGIGLPAPLKTYTGKYFSFSIKYPSNWIIFETPNGNHGDHEVIATVQVPGRSWPFLAIASRRFIDGNINQVSNWGYQRINNLTDLREVSLAPFTTTYYHGFVRDYLWTDNDPLFGQINVESKDYYILDDNKGYILSFSSEQEKWGDVDAIFLEMVNSFIVNQRVEGVMSNNNFSGIYQPLFVIFLFILFSILNIRLGQNRIKKGDGSKIMNIWRIIYSIPILILSIIIVIILIISSYVH
jgi:hypothetical protein